MTGDGSLSCMLNEISLIKKHNLSINIFLLNNDGQSMIRQTQDQWLSSNYLGSSHDGGLAKINFCKVVSAFGIQTTKVKHNNKIRISIKECLKRKQSFCEVVINQNKRVVPQVIFGRPNEDQDPLLPINEYYENMIIKPIKR